MDKVLRTNLLLVVLVVCASRPGSGVVGGESPQDPCRELAGKRIRWIVPHAAGGGYDTWSRLIEPFLEKELGVRVVVENVSGASGRIGNRVVSEAPPDGLTVGILNGSGLISAALCGEDGVRQPADFTVLARLSRNRSVWATGRDSPFQTIDDVLVESRRRPILFAIRGVGTSSFLSASLGAHLLGMDMEFVAGYRGSRDNALAALRGEVDLVAHTFEAIRESMERGDLRPLLQIGDAPVADHKSLRDVPLLGGTSGMAVREARRLGRDVEATQADATALYDLLGAGRWIATAPKTPSMLADCLRKALHRVLKQSGFRKAAKTARRSLDIADSDTVQAECEAVALRARKFIPILQDAIAKLRG